MQLDDSTEGLQSLHGQFGHILISSGTTAVLVFCGFVSGSVIINVISWTRVLKTLHTMAHNYMCIYTYSLKKAINIVNYKPCRNVT